MQLRAAVANLARAVSRQTEPLQDGAEVVGLHLVLVAEGVAPLRSKPGLLGERREIVAHARSCSATRLRGGSEPDCRSCVPVANRIVPASAGTRAGLVPRLTAMASVPPSPIRQRA